MHADFNSFYASVACRLDPSLSTRPVAVAGDPAKRHGIILAKNELAKKFGVKTAETIWQAKQKCPNLVVVPPDYEAYRDFSERGRRIYAEYSDYVEGFGLDENWIDLSVITCDFFDARDMAETIRARILDELGITVSIGVANNKVFSKLGSDIKKPNAVTLVSPENYREVAWPLPATDLLYVGRATGAKLTRYGILTIGDLANTPQELLRSIFGKCGLMLHAFANGRDVAPVQPLGYEAPPKSVGNGITAPRDLIDDTDVFMTVFMLSESVAARLRAQGLRARLVSLGVRDTGLYTFVRQCRLPHATDLASEIAEAAMQLFAGNYTWTIPIRSVTVTAGDLLTNDAPAQLTLFSDEGARIREHDLEATVDGIRERFGYNAIGRAMYLNRDRFSDFKNPGRDEPVHPVGYLQNYTMDDVIGL